LKAPKHRLDNNSLRTLMKFSISEKIETVI